MTSVLQPWLSNIPLREQGVLVITLRGPDGVPKEHGAKNIVRAIRGCIMVPGATGAPLLPGQNLPDDSFMQMYRIGHVDEGPWQEATLAFFRAWDELNVHFLFHLLHAAAVLGIRHPESRVRTRWWDFYCRGMRKAHVNPETPEQLMDRLKDGHKPDAPE